MDDKVAYEEAGRVHRHFLNWRHAAFAGYFAVLYAVGTLCVQVWDKHPLLLPVLLLAASPIGIALAALDKRTRQLYNAAQEAAKAIESKLLAGSSTKPEPIKYVYERLISAKDNDERGVPGTHSRWLARLYWGYSVLLAIAGLAVLWWRFCR